MSGREGILLTMNSNLKLFILLILLYYFFRRQKEATETTQEGQERDGRGKATWHLSDHVNMSMWSFLQPV